MPLQTRVSSGMALAQELTLPPPFTAVRLRDLGDAFGHAVSSAREHGAGTLVYVGRYDLAEFALVVEPDEPLRSARRVFYAGMAALCDALSAAAQPETSITVEWPDSIHVNLGLVGGGRLAWPADADENAVPPWLVFGAIIRTQAVTGGEPGEHPGITTLGEEGFADVTSNQVVESFARNFMFALDAWQELGFAAMAKGYIDRLPRGQGLRRDIDENGDLLTRIVTAKETERHALLPRLARPSWFDPKSGQPRA